jgi:hypothetical protein
MATSDAGSTRDNQMEAEPITLTLGPTGRGYLYINEILIGPVEDARLTVCPDDPKPDSGAGFVELSVRLREVQWARLDRLESPISDFARWRFKIAAPAPRDFPELVIERGRGERAGESRLVVKSAWDRVEANARPWSIAPASPPPDFGALD